MSLSSDQSRLTKFFEIDYPIISAPMALAAGGKLAAAVSRGGGLGLIGGGYGDPDWLDEQFGEVGNEDVGCGFITWHLDEALKTAPSLLDRVLERKPKTLLLSFGSPAFHAKKIEEYSVPLICQVQTIEDCRQAIDAGACVIVAQGAEAGGHGRTRGTMSLVPEAADLLAKRAPDIVLCAAGGIADGRGLAASLMLGAEGVMVGSRFWASAEASVHPNMISAALAADGDETIRSKVMDIARHYDWPSHYTARVLKNAFTDRWHDDIDGLIENANEQAQLWKTAWAKGDTNIANTFVGEATGLINEVQPAADIIKNMMDEAEECLRKFA